MALEELLASTEAKFKKAIEALRHDAASVRTGRAAPRPAFQTRSASPLSGASGKRVEVSGAAAYNGSCRSEGARP